MSNILVSVIIPTYNDGAAISAPIESIKRQQQPENKRVDYEIIVIDDASTEERFRELERIALRDKSIKLIRNSMNKGPSAARNRGLRKANGDYVSFLDADDSWPDNKIKLLLPLFDNPTIEVAGGKVKYVIKPGVEIDLNKWEDNQHRITHVHLGALLVRREVFDRGYLFDEELRYSEDMDWWLRIREDNLGIAIIEVTTLLYQVHGANMSFGKDIRELDVLKVLHKSVQRRKLKGANYSIPQLRDFRNKRDNLPISVVIPLYNGKDVIQRAIQSVMNQTFKNVEIIVVDDGSTDGGADLVAEQFPEVKIVRQQNKGVAAARNAGVAHAEGELIAFLDQDDEWLPEKLQKQSAMLQNDPYCGWVTCNQRFVWDDNAHRPRFFKPEIEKPHRSFVPSGLLIRKHVLLSVGGFDESLRMGSDIDLIRKLRNHQVKEKNVDEVLLKKWYDGTNESYKTAKNMADILAILHKQVGRK